VESTVGTIRLEKSSFATFGYSHLGAVYRFHEHVMGSTKYSKTVSPYFLQPYINLHLPSASSSAAMLQHNQIFAPFPRLSPSQKF